MGAAIPDCEFSEPSRGWTEEVRIKADGFINRSFTQDAGGKDLSMRNKRVNMGGVKGVQGQVIVHVPQAPSSENRRAATVATQDTKILFRVDSEASIL